MKYVYEFTNKRKLTKAEFLRWFQKKFLYTMRKFNMASKGDVIGYKDKQDFRSVVLKDLLKMYSEKSFVEIVKGKSKKANKFAVSDTSDSVTFEIVNEIIKGKISKLKNVNPVNDKEIKPLFLFLDKEVELYAKLKGLKYNKIKVKKDGIFKFIESLEKKHPELKHSVVQSYLELFC